MEPARLSCPNCGKSSPAGASDCSHCGIVFLKWLARAKATAAGASAAMPAPEPRPAPVVPTPGAPVTRLALAAAGALALVLFLARGPVRRAFFLLDWADLLIHEAGHPIFGLLGNRFLMMAGGTLLQLLMPLAFWWDFRRRGQPRSSDACLLWVGQNLLHIGRYAADARAQDLPLVGGGEHDWTYLLEVFGLLRHDLTVGAAFDLAGCALMAWAIVSIIERTRVASRASQ